MPRCNKKSDAFSVLPLPVTDAFLKKACLWCFVFVLPLCTREVLAQAKRSVFFRTSGVLPSGRARMDVWIRSCRSQGQRALTGGCCNLWSGPERNSHCTSTRSNEVNLGCRMCSVERRKVPRTPMQAHQQGSRQGFQVQALSLPLTSSRQRPCLEVLQQPKAFRGQSDYMSW